MSIFKSTLVNKILLIFLIGVLIYVFYSSYLDRDFVPFEFFNGIKRKENIDHIYLHIGNHLSNYFHRMGLAILQQSDFTNEEYTENFLKYLPSELVYSESDICKSTYARFKEKGVTIENSTFAWSAEWYIKNDNQMNFWICMKPLINHVLDAAFKKTGINTPIDCPIIHFRCADVPFVKHHQYHFVKYEFYRKALEEVTVKTGVQYNKVKILYSPGHLSKKEYDDACDIYSQSLKKYLENLNYEVEIYSNTDIEDFANMFYAPATIAAVSSYSFMSGFFGNGLYITSEHHQEDDEKAGCSQGTCGEWMLEGYLLKHKMVDDYTDTNNVISLLRDGGGSTM